jgi:beta-glucosidase
VHVHKVNHVDGPLKTLKRFQSVDIAAGKIKKAVASLPHNPFELFDRASGKMVEAAAE